jgi:outer membrane lipoprotein-sorting protein
MKRSKIVLVLLTLIITGSSFCQDNDQFTPVENVEALKNMLQENTRDITTIVSDFIQEKHLAMLDEVLISKGRFIFKRENSLRWEYNEPIEYLIIIHKGEFMIRDENRVSRYEIESNPVFREINNIIVNMVSGRLPDEDDFKVSFYENGLQYLTELSPAKPEVGNILSTIQVYLDKKDLTVSKVKLIESSEDHTIIRFINKQLNIELQEDVFSPDN